MIFSLRTANRRHQYVSSSGSFQVCAGLAGQPIPDLFACGEKHQDSEFWTEAMQEGVMSLISMGVAD